jgi:hypothetical protein
MFARSLIEREITITSMIPGLSTGFLLQITQLRMQLQSWVNQMLADPLLNVDNARDLLCHLGRCDDYMSSLSLMVERCGVPRLVVGTEYYRPPGTVWRRVFASELASGVAADVTRLRSTLPARAAEEARRPAAVPLMSLTPPRPIPLASSPSRPLCRPSSRDRVLTSVPVQEEPILFRNPSPVIPLMAVRVARPRTLPERVRASLVFLLIY